MSEPVPIVALDSNVLLRYLLDDHEELSGQAAAVLEDMQQGRVLLRCDPVNLAEVVWVLGSFYKQPNEAISAALEPIVKHDGFLLPNKAMYLRALEMFAGGVRHFGDACACANAMDDCEGRLYSFDRKLRSVPGIEIMQPPRT